ncbi:unnamed protein product [Vitrella brassicaformis CCMP3155]|uniref:Uncharacterized protein n=1 Tax=Vitrella brassicaformis (strain CCMP3155) TaxID=1169540 RepID=A0A0G4H3T2_VITBC|nr:unnamed protein product [Vitrella brassicaformis CCMP3155]|eukprot:CEM38177.1 unnamed protein product [Vitrella brassicaformis CCMP3155]
MTEVPILTTPSGRQVPLPYKLGRGSRAIVRGGFVDNCYRAFKVATEPQPDDSTANGVWRVACEEMTVEVERMATIQAMREERNGQRASVRPFLRLFSAATRPDDGATYQESPSKPPRRCVYIEMQPLNGPDTPATTGYISLHDLIFKKGYNLPEITAKHKGNPEIILRRVTRLARALQWAAATLKRALEEDGLVCPDHGLNNVFVNSVALDCTNRTDTFIIDLANTLHTSPPGPSMCSDDGTIPSPPPSHRPAALIPTKRAARKAEKQLPTFIKFHAAPEQLAFLVQTLKENPTGQDVQEWGGDAIERPGMWESINGLSNEARAELRQQGLWVGEGSREGMWMTSHTLAFNLGCTAHNAIRGELYSTPLLAKRCPKPPQKPPKNATEAEKTAYDQQLEAFGQEVNVLQAMVSLDWDRVRRAIMDQEGHPKGGKPGLKEAKDEPGLEWAGEAVRRLNHAAERALRTKISERASLSELEGEFAGVVEYLEGVKKAKAGDSPAAAASLPSTAASPEGAHCTTPPAPPPASASPPVANATPSQGRAVISPQPASRGSVLSFEERQEAAVTHERGEEDRSGRPLNTQEQHPHAHTPPIQQQETATAAPPPPPQPPRRKDTSPAPLAAAIPSQAGAVNSRHADQDAGQVAVFEQTDEREEGTPDAREPSVPAAPDVHHTPIPPRAPDGHHRPAPAAPPPQPPRRKATLLKDIKAAQKARAAPRQLPRANGIPAHHLPYVAYHAKIVHYDGHTEGGWKWNPLVDEWEMWQPSGEGEHLWEVRAATQDMRVRWWALCSDVGETAAAAGQWVAGRLGLGCRTARRT